MAVGWMANVGLIAISLLVGCSSSGEPPAPPRPAPVLPELDGTYHVQIDGARTLRDGGPNPEASSSLQWAFRSSCGNACIAVGVPVSEDEPPQTGQPTVWDFVDGAWVKTVTGQLACGGTPTPTMETWSLRPGAGGTLTGIRYLAFFGPGCGSVLEQFVTVNRSGNVNPAVAIPDPATQAALEPSAGAGLRGRYTKTQTRQGQPAVPVIEIDVATNCVRNTEHCLTYTVYEPPDKPRRVRAYQLLDGRWSSTVPYDATCPDGSAVRLTVETEWPMPERPADPILRVVGSQRDVYPEPCAKTIESQLVLERIGG